MIRIVGDDMWDPNNWVESDYEHRIYADDTLLLYAVVDAIDYPYLSQFKWSVHSVDLGTRAGKPRKTSTRKKLYLRRGVSVFHAPDSGTYVSPEHGYVVRARNRTQHNLFLHQEIVARMGLKPATSEHKIIDHKDRDTLNCRRNNLHWATYSGNRDNGRPQ
jgi:hypothetical protein